MKIHTLLTLLICFSGSCISYTPHPFTTTETFSQLLTDSCKTIDTTHAQILTDDSLEIKLDSVIYIPLSDDVLIGTINKIVIYQDRIYILDAFMTQKVYIYDLSGRLIRTIHSKGRGPREYVGLSDMTIQRDSAHLVLYDHKTFRRLFYDLEGNFIRKEQGTPCFYFAYTHGVFVCQMGYLQRFDKNQNDQLVTFTGDSALRTAFPYYPIQRNNYLSHALIENWRNELLFTPTYSDTVYTLNSDSTYYAKYTVQHKRSIWSKAEEPLTYDDVNRLVKQEGYTQFSGNFLETADVAWFTVDVAHPNGILSVQYLYDKQTGRIYRRPNSLDAEPMTSHSGSLTVNRLYAVTQPIAVWKDYFITSFDAYNMAIYRKSDNLDITDPQLNEVIRNAHENSNPVLALFKFKNPPKSGRK